MTLPPYPKFHDGFNGLDKSCSAIIAKEARSVNKFFVNFSIFRAACCMIPAGSVGFLRPVCLRRTAGGGIVDKMQ